MKIEEIHINEENIQFFWGLTAILAIALASYMLINAFMTGDWAQAGYKQISSLILFFIGFYSIIQVSSPLFYFVLKVSDSILTIEIWNEGAEPMDVQTINLKQIGELYISPHATRSSKEALFDFSTNYHLIYRNKHSNNFRQLIHLPGKSFTLKVQDIRRIISFLKDHNPEIHVPEQEVWSVQFDQKPLNPLKTKKM